MTNIINQMRRWALIKLAAGDTVALNLRLTKGLYVHASTKNALFVNVHVEPDALTSFVIGKEIE